MVLNHVHQYIKRKDKKDWYMCAHQGCTSIVPKALIKDKEIMCSICQRNTLILNNYNRRLAKPRCESCSTTQESKQRRMVKDAMDRIFEPKEVTNNGL